MSHNDGHPTNDNIKDNDSSCLQQQHHFRITTPSNIKCLTDGVLLQSYALKNHNEKINMDDGDGRKNNLEINKNEVSVAFDVDNSDIDDRNRSSRMISLDNNNVINKSRPVILPWIGFGTYRIGKNHTKQAVLQAIEYGYRHIGMCFYFYNVLSSLFRIHPDERMYCQSAFWIV